MDKFHDLKADTQAVVTSAVDHISDAVPLKKITENEQLRSFGSRIWGTINGATEAIKGMDLSHVTTPEFNLSTMDNPSSSSVWQRFTDWASKYKILISVVAVTVTGSTIYYLYKINVGDMSGPSFLRLPRKRQAKKAANGGRVEVVVIAGSPAEPLTRTIATDLSRRGYIVYWTTSSKEEEEVVLRERSDDIRPFPIQPQGIASVRSSIKALANILNTPALAFPGAVPHMLSFAGLIVVPDLYYPSGPVEAIRVDTWNDLLNSKILGPVFLLSNGLLELVRTHQSRVLLVSPTIMGSLNPGYHAAESMITAALDALSLSAFRELRPQRIPFIHIRMGSFDVSHGGAGGGGGGNGHKQHERQVQNSVRADILSWPENLRALYARPYQFTAMLQTAGAGTGSGVVGSRSLSVGSPLRTLNYTIFDALTARNPARVYYAGKGSFLYHILPKWLPESFVTWLVLPPVPPAPVPVDGGWDP